VVKLDFQGNGQAADGSCCYGWDVSVETYDEDRCTETIIKFQDTS
jgi:hypothetical protein